MRMLRLLYFKAFSTQIWEIRKLVFLLCHKNKVITRTLCFHKDLTYYPVYLWSGLNFINVLREAFTHTDPKSVKDTDDLTVFFTLSWSVSIKAAPKTLVKLTPVLLYLWTCRSVLHECMRFVWQVDAAAVHYLYYQSRLNEYPMRTHSLTHRVLMFYLKSKDKVSLR